MQAIFKYFGSLGWDKRVTVVTLYVLFPAIVGTLTRVAGINPMLGDFFEVDLGDGITGALVALIAYVCGTVLFFLALSKIRFRHIRSFAPNPRRVNLLGIFVFCYQIAALLFTLQSGFGVAANADSVDSNYKLLFILLSSDYIFFVYFLLAREKPALVFSNAVIYLVYSVMRGWGSGILLLLILAYVKFADRVKWKQVFIWLCFLFALAPLLLGAREFFRNADGGGSDVGAAVSLVLDNINYDDVIFLLLNRFDLVPPTQAFDMYYHTLQAGLTGGTVCYAWNEGIYQTVINALLKSPKCVAAGEALPSLIHGQFYFDRRSAFSVGAGWLYGADGIAAVTYALYIGFLLTVSRIFGGPLLRLPEIRGFFVFLIVVYLVPGWYFHFIQGMNAVLFANLFIRLVRGKDHARRIPTKDFLSDDTSSALR